MQPLTDDLLRWYRRERRAMPWRSDPTPYKVWISEIMLQQTQVATVVPYFERWIEAFPDALSLSQAPIDDVLAKWSGLGYYRRAHLIHRAAGLLVEKHGGQLPRDLEALLAMPGVGRYTAGAIASIAFNLPAPILDGNVMRVLSRVFIVEGNPRKGQANARLWDLAQGLIPDGEARDFNQSLMELGALVCSPRKPDCQGCPISDHCRAFAEDRVAALPELPKRKKKRPMFVATALLSDGPAGQYLLVKRPSEGLFGGLFETPGVVLDGLPAPGEARRRLAEHLSSLGIEATLDGKLEPVDHTLTHIQMKIQPFTARLDSARPRLGAGARWVRVDELDDQPLSSATRKVIARLRAAAQGSLDF